MSASPVLFDSAYPGSMHKREYGDYVDRNDNASLAAALLENMQALRIRVNDLEAVASERDRLKALNAELAAALSGMVEITELTIGWLPTPPNADGPLIVARAALAKHNRETQ